MTKIISFWALLSRNPRNLLNLLKEIWSKNYLRLTLLHYNQQKLLKDAVWLGDQTSTLKKILRWKLIREIARFKQQTTFWNNIKLLSRQIHLHTLLQSADPQSNNRPIVFHKTSKLPPKFPLKSLLIYSIRFQGSKLSRIIFLNHQLDHSSANRIKLVEIIYNKQAVSKEVFQVWTILKLVQFSRTWISIMS